MFEKEKADFEIVRKSKIEKMITSGESFYVADMDKKKIYKANDLRLSDLLDKVDRDDVFLFKKCSYGE